MNVSPRKKDFLVSLLALAFIMVSITTLVITDRTREIIPGAGTVGRPRDPPATAPESAYTVPGEVGYSAQAAAESCLSGRDPLISNTDDREAEINDCFDLVLTKLFYDQKITINEALDFCFSLPTNQRLMTDNLEMSHRLYCVYQLGVFPSYAGAILNVLGDFNRKYDISASSPNNPQTATDEDVRKAESQYRIRLCSEYGRRSGSKSATDGCLQALIPRWDVPPCIEKSLLHQWQYLVFDLCAQLSKPSELEQCRGREQIPVCVTYDKPAIPGVQYEGGDGLNEFRPVRIVSAPDDALVARAEESYIKANFTHYTTFSIARRCLGSNVRGEHVALDRARIHIPTQPEAVILYFEATVTDCERNPFFAE